MPSTRLLRPLNLAVFVGVLYGNFVAATGGMSGENIGTIANRYASRFLPADYVFGIWSLIYLALVLSLGYQLWPGARGRAAVERLGWWWTVCGALNVAWISLFSFSRYLEALGVMLVFLGALIVLGERVRSAPAPDVLTRAFVVWPHDLYLAWISVAVIANTFQVAHVVGFSGFGIPETAWAVMMMAVATGLGALMAVGRRNWLFPFVVAWALRGIGDRYADDAVLATASSVCVAVGLAGGVGAIVWQRRAPRVTPA